MNILIMLGVAALGLAVIWAAQSVALALALALAGEPLTWPPQYTTRKPLARWTGRVAVHVSWLIIMVGTPLALGISPLDALHRAFPTPVPWRDIAIAFAIMFFPYAAVYAIYIATGLVRIAPQHDPATRRAKLLRRFLGPLPLATLEEAVFRGVVLEQLLQALPPTSAGTVVAIIVSSAAFSAVHFVKRAYPGKPVWQPAFGLFVVNCLLAVAYVVDCRSLWLPIALHAAAVFVTEVARLYVAYQGPAWLIGFAEFPHCGLVGTVFLVCVGIALVVLI